VDYTRPIEAIVPGVQGRVLAVLCRNHSEMTIRTVARLAGVSAQQCSVVVAELVRLGLVSRREAGPSSLVALDRGNEAARMVAELGDLMSRVVARLTEAAERISPPPASVTMFGSFARGEAHAESDVDVLAVRARGVEPDDGGWVDSLGEWAERARHVTGNVVNMVVLGEDEVPSLLRRRSGPWRTIGEDGVVLAGRALAEIVAA
jgi:predicted nucleotidyltransferase